MAQRTYLIKSNPFEAVILFEANNMLPFFWLTLIREKDLELAEATMRKKYEAVGSAEEDTADADNTTIRISKQNAITNGLTSSPFLEDNFPDKLALYHDFIAYLDKHTADDDYLELDIFSLAAFDGIESFLLQLKGDLKALDMYEAEKVSDYFNDRHIATLTGHGDFPGENAAVYTTIYHPVSTPAAGPFSDTEGPVRKASLPVAILVIVAGAALMYLPYRGYLTDGITLAVFFCLLAAVAVLFTGCKQLLSAIRK